MAGLTAEQLLPINEVYSADIKAKFQSSQRLMGIMPEISNIGGVRHDWIGTTLEMNQVGFGAANLPSDQTSFTPVLTVPLRLILKTTIAEADQSLTNVDLQRAHANMHGKAAARMLDILKIRALFNNAAVPLNTFNTVPVTVGPNTGLNTYKLQAMASILDNNDVDENPRIFYTNSDQYNTLRNEDRYINYFTSEKNAINNDLKPYAGFRDMRMLGKESSNNVPIFPTGAEFTSYGVGFHHEACQFMYNIPLRTVITYDGTNLNYTIVSEIVANAQIMQLSGIVLGEFELDANGNPGSNPNFVANPIGYVKTATTAKTAATAKTVKAAKAIKPDDLISEGE